MTARGGTNRRERSRPSRIDPASSALVGFCTFCILAWTSSFLPLTWDEGEMNRRAEEKTFLSDNAGLEGHPQFPVLLVAAGKAAAPRFLPERVKLRFGPIVFFSFAVGCVFHRLCRAFDRTTALFGVASILLVPRLFAHAQIAAWDSPLTAFWLLSWAVFPYALKSTTGIVLFACCVGGTAASKFSGLAAIVPFVVWMLPPLFGPGGKTGPETRTENVASRGFLRFARTALRAALFCATAVAAFLVLNPPFWNDPAGGIVSFFHRNMNRDINVSILFLGKTYDLYHPLPWYNTLFWTAATVPLGLLFLFAAGTYEIVRDADKRGPGLLILLNMATLLVVRAFPGTPVHDGVRLFVASFPFLSIAAGIGAASLWNLSFREKSRVMRIVSRGVVLAALAVPLLNMLWYAPQWLSYYNGLIGGLPGAVRAGMEATYYWDGFDDEVLDRLDADVLSGEAVVFSVGSYRTFRLYREENRLRFPFEIAGPETSFDELKHSKFRYYVLQRRGGAEFERDKRFIREETPVFVKTIRQGGFGPWNLGSVPLLAVYDLADSPDRN